MTIQSQPNKTKIAQLGLLLAAACMGLTLVPRCAARWRLQRPYRLGRAHGHEWPNIRIARYLGQWFSRLHAPRQRRRWRLWSQDQRLG